MRTVLVVDDQSLALQQVIVNFPDIAKNDIDFRHLNSLKALREFGTTGYFAVFLDFFLSVDRDYGTAILPALQCEHLVCFSSKSEMSEHMAAQATDQPSIRNVYSVQKHKGSLANPALAQVLRVIFGHPDKDSSE